MSNINYIIEDLRLDPPYRRITTREEALWSIRAEMDIDVDNRNTVFVRNFYIVEFTEQLSQWLRNPNEVFDYVSVIYKERELIAFRPAVGDWRLDVNGYWLNYLHQSMVKHKDLVTASRKFVDDLKYRLNREFNIQIWKYCDIQ